MTLTPADCDLLAFGLARLPAAEADPGGRRRADRPATLRRRHPHRTGGAGRRVLGRAMTPSPHEWSLHRSRDASLSPLRSLEASGWWMLAKGAMSSTRGGGYEVGTG